MSSVLPVTLAAATSRRRGKVLVGPVDLSLGPKGVTGIIGPNGSGKTTLLRLLHGTARLSSGAITWACPEDDARARQTFVFQRPILLRRSTGENLAYPLAIKGQPKPQITEAVDLWANRVGLSALLDRPAQSLSGGEQQKLAIARALITDPEILFLDEPCAALDGRATREIERILTDAQRAGTRLILATHDMGQARRLCDDVVFLLNGAVHESGEAKAFFDTPNTPQAAAFLRGDIVE